MKFLLLTVSAFVAVAFADQQVAFKLAPLHGSATDSKSKDQFIVVLKSDSNTQSDLNIPSQRFAQHKAWLLNMISSPAMSSLEVESGVTSVINSFIRIGQNFEGYSARLSDVMLNEIRSNPDVDYVERDLTFHTTVPVTGDAPYLIRRDTTWGLQRISEREALKNPNAYVNKYNSTMLLSEAGEGSTVYVVDTGIFVGHSEFNGRAVWGGNFATGSVDKDVHGHGTHCAGTVAGSRYGVAPKANVVAVKVLDDNGYGYNSWIIGGINFVVQKHLSANAQGLVPSRRTIISMSLGGGYSRALNQAVNAAVSKNVFVVVAAGNENEDACSSSPASAELAFTIAASDVSDSRAWFSNYGRCSDLFAPGVDVYSASNSNPNGYRFMSGTSMATPHVAGAVAALWSGLPPSTSVKELKSILTKRSTKDAIKSVMGTPNHLLYVRN